MTKTELAQDLAEGVFDQNDNEELMDSFVAAINSGIIKPEQVKVVSGRYELTDDILELETDDEVESLGISVTLDEKMDAEMLSEWREDQLLYERRCAEMGVDYDFPDN